MNDQENELDQVDEEILACEFSDEELESAAEASRLQMTMGTQSFCWPGGCLIT
jgi:hypothetical protein